MIRVMVVFGVSMAPTVRIIQKGGQARFVSMTWDGILQKSSRTEEKESTVLLPVNIRLSRLTLPILHC